MRTGPSQGKLCNVDDGSERAAVGKACGSLAGGENPLSKRMVVPVPHSLVPPWCWFKLSYL